MRILDRYILQSFVGPFLFGVCAFTAVFVGTGTLFRIAEYITDYGASLWLVTQVFILSLPSIIVLTFPMSALLGSLMTFGRLSGGSEIIVMRAGGQPFLRLALPVYILCFLLSIGTTLFNEYVVPASNHAYRTLVREEIKKQALPPTQNNVVLTQVDEGQMRALLYAASFDRDTRMLHNLTVQEFEHGQVVRVEHADTATWDRGRWIMHEGVIYDLTAPSGTTRSLTFKEQELPLDIAPDSVGKRKTNPEEMTIKELRAQILAYEASGVQTTELWLTLYSRFAIPLATFVFALIGSCLGLQPQRSSSSIGFGISVVLIFIYYGIMTLSQAFGKAGVLPAAFAAFLPDLIGLGLGLYLNWRVAR